MEIHVSCAQIHYQIGASQRANESFVYPTFIRIGTEGQHTAMTSNSVKTTVGYSEVQSSSTA